MIIIIITTTTIINEKKLKPWTWFEGHDWKL
jgi:hypothetical protein